VGGGGGWGGVWVGGGGASSALTLAHQDSEEHHSSANLSKATSDTCCGHRSLVNSWKGPCQTQLPGSVMAELLRACDWVTHCILTG
jgi:hypothetical protein